MKYLVLLSLVGCVGPSPTWDPDLDAGVDVVADAGDPDAAYECLGLGDGPPETTATPQGDCANQCGRVAHCASTTWDDGGDLCPCLWDQDHDRIRTVCLTWCTPERATAMAHLVVCSELVPQTPFLGGVCQAVRVTP